MRQVRTTTLLSFGSPCGTVRVAEPIPVIWVCKRKRPRAGSLWVDSLAPSSVPPFHGLSRRLRYQLLAVLVAYMLQHCTGGLRSGAAESVIELVDAHGVQALVASENHAARVSVDRVHHAEHTPALFHPARK
jgi:hypothetical protein